MCSLFYSSAACNRVIVSSPSMVRSPFPADGFLWCARLPGFYTFDRMAFLICLIFASSRL